jgi:hypothetical protein
MGDKLALAKRALKIHKTTDKHRLEPDRAKYIEKLIKEADKPKKHHWYRIRINRKIIRVK